MIDIPLVSIVMPTYNRARYIREAIQSVQHQAYAKWELIIVDDASTDDTESIVRELMQEDGRIRYIKQASNVGIAANRNAGLAAAQGTYIAPLDSDDIWLDPEKLSKQVSFLETHPEYALVGTQVTTINEAGAPMKSFTYETSDVYIRKEMLARNQFTQSSVLFRTSAAQEAGGYDPSIIVLDDYGLWLKIGIKHRFANLPDFATGYRIHAGAITKTRKVKAAQEHLDIIRKYKNSYPRYPFGLIKGYLRLLKAFSGI